MNPRIQEVSPQQDFTLQLVFTSGEVKVFDMKPFLDKGVFIKLKDWNFFKQARVSFGTVVWPDELDMSPDTLYLRSVLESNSISP